jgi:tetratricopeptide (TPR) repeat protein
VAVPAPEPTPERVDAALDSYLQHQVEQARLAQAQGRWADAALAWEVSSLLRPDDHQIRAAWAHAQRRIDALAEQHRGLAEAARARGDLELATQSYLAMLALDPGRRDAADALRRIERERNRGSLVGRFARAPSLRRQPGDAVAPAVDNTEPGRAANSQREHATLLARQGQLDSAIQMLRESPSLSRDAAHRALLADLYVQKAEALRLQQPGAARVAVEAALALDRRHPAALALLAKLPKVRPAPPAPSAAPATGR